MKLFFILLATLNAFTKQRGKNIIIITRENCGYSQAMRDLLEEKNIPYLDLNEDLLNANIKAITMNPEHTYPSVYIDGELIGGYTEAIKHSYFNDSTKDMNKILNY